MEINELKQLRDFSELDMLYKIIEIAENNKNRTEEFLKGNKTAGTDVRKTMQDIRFLSELIRESIQISKNKKKVETGDYKGRLIELTKIEKAIVDKEISLAKEEESIKAIEAARRKK